ncbi:MAG: peptidoglycan-binding domain-containing protein [Coriobacteriales bacterium]|nr:peptidoglycan-binding protein [Actinomycetes bacterium]
MQRRSVLLVAGVALVGAMLVPSTALAHTARRGMSDMSCAENTTIDGESAAWAWIATDHHAKGWYRDHYNYYLSIVLADKGIHHHDTSTNRPGSYWLKDDPYNLTHKIQYTLYYMDYRPCARDDRFGPETSARVREFQSANGLAVDGIVGTNTYFYLAKEAH